MLIRDGAVQADGQDVHPQSLQVGNAFRSQKGAIGRNRNHIARRLARGNDVSEFTKEKRFAPLE
jgi:hypothetical protein